MHNLAYQGFTDGAWLRHLGPRGRHYEWFGGTNPLSGAIALADAIVAVSPTHAREILTPGRRVRPRRRAASSLGRRQRDPQRHRHDDVGPGDRPVARGELLGARPRPPTATMARAANRAAVRTRAGFADDDVPLAVVVPG